MFGDRAGVATKFVNYDLCVNGRPGVRTLATLKDIGAALGLSTATVSRALNGYPEVNAKTRALVLDMATRLHYRPNQIARKLVTGRSGMVGVIPCRHTAEAYGSGLLGFLLGLSERLAANDIDLVVHVAANDDEVGPYRRLVEKQTLDGMIITAPVEDDPRITYLESEGVPFVVHGRTGPEDRFPFFDVDHFAATRQVLELLCDLGHQRVSLIAGRQTHWPSRDHANGFATGAEELGLAVPDAMFANGTTSEEGGYLATLKALGGAFGRPPTALICTSTCIAAGAYRAANDRGLTVPSDLSIIAHDDGAETCRVDAFSPSLTVARSQIKDAAFPTADLMMSVLDEDATGQSLTVLPEIILAGSTGPAPADARLGWGDPVA